jgi:hypothetical protein
MTKSDYLDPAKNPKMTSTEAAAMYLSNGMTKDVAKAKLIDANKATELNMDALQRAHLRRMMGFDFQVKFAPNKIHISTQQEPYLSTHCKLKDGDITEDGYITNMPTVDRLVDACGRLKVKHDTEMAKRTP